VLGQELYLHTFLETNDITQAQRIATSCQSGDDSGVINWLQTQKNVLTASESSMVKSQVMVETEARILPILDHMANALKYAPRVVECSETLQKLQGGLGALRSQHAEACTALHGVDGTLVPALQQVSDQLYACTCLSV
jgi:hypothetical protein